MTEEEQRALFAIAEALKEDLKDAYNKLSKATEEVRCIRQALEAAKHTAQECGCTVCLVVRAATVR